MEHINVKSSNIKSIGYDSEESILEIAFLNGSVYRYYNVPNNLYQGLMNASSHGSFLDAYIKKAGYTYKQIG